MPKLTITLFYSCSFLLLTGACASHDSSEVDPPHVVTCTPADAELSYADDIVPIITENCVNPVCHGGDSDIPDWSEHAELASHKEEIKFRITRPDSDPQKMPKEGSITDEERQALYCWIENGAPNN